MERFCKDNVMRYQWLKYVPALLTSGFEHPLFSLIRDQIQHAAIFQTWQSRSLSVPSKVKIVPAAYIHENEPILPDLNQEIYLAPEYDSNAYKMLGTIGIQTMTPDDFVKRLIHDVGGFASKLRATDTTDSWHSTLSKAISAILDSPKNASLHPAVRSLKLIKLRKTTGQASEPTHPPADWVSAINVHRDAVYFPEQAITPGFNDVVYRNSISIPFGLALRVVDPGVTHPLSRRQLLVKLGVLECPPSTVVDAIHDYHYRLLKPNSGTRSTLDSISHLQYLFWQSPAVSSITRPLSMPTEGNVFVSITERHYLKTDGQYDTWSLLKDQKLGDRRKLANFVAEAVETAESDTVHRNGRYWKQWLQEAALAQRHPPLTIDFLGQSLSPVMLHILEHANEKFISILQSHWEAAYRWEISIKPSIKPVLREVKVLCDHTPATPLAKTYMPTKALKTEADRVGLLCHVPFVRLPVLIDDADETKWNFLLDLGVRSRLDPDFYFELLLITQRRDEVETFSTLATVTKLYGMQHWQYPHPPHRMM
jgi:hypothetical protein